MNYLLLVLSLSVLGSLCSLEREASSVDYWDESILFEIEWPGKQKVLDGVSLRGGSHVSDVREDREGEEAVLVKKLPNELLGVAEKDDAEPVVLVTAEKESYSCVLPNVAQEGSLEEDEWMGMDALNPETLLRPLQEHCLRLSIAYWNYELCFGRHLRQFHEEKRAANELPKVDEYYLGRVDEAGTTKLDAIESYKQGERVSKEIPTWHFNGLDYPYYEEVMGGGTPCDLMNGEPRVTRIMFICDREAPLIGMLLNVEEVTTCRYDAVIATRQLCRNKAYRLKESPVHTINCFARENSPKRPRILLEHELAASKRASVSNPPTSQLPPPSPRRDTTSSQSDKMQEHPSSLGLDSRFVDAIMTGEMCLRGGASWWQHELCFGQHVKQVHMEGGFAKKTLFLGFWDEEKHKEWFSKAGKRKQSKTHVTNLYVGGDICDVTGVARQCLVRFKCLKSSKSSQISLYLEEPTTCSYILTVEGGFICPLLETVDKYGILHYTDQTLTDSLDDEDSEDAGSSG